MFDKQIDPANTTYLYAIEDIEFFPKFYGANTTGHDFAFGWSYYKRAFQAITDPSGYLPRDTNGNPVFTEMTDPETGMHLELHEEGGQIFQYVLYEDSRLPDTQCLGDFQKITSASSGQLIMAERQSNPNDPSVYRF